MFSWKPGPHDMRALQALVVGAHAPWGCLTESSEAFRAVHAFTHAYQDRRHCAQDILLPTRKGTYQLCREWAGCRSAVSDSSRNVLDDPLLGMLSIYSAAAQYRVGNCLALALACLDLPPDGQRPP